MISTVIHTASDGFETLYHSLRKKEGRIYDDTELLNLPAISKAHSHYGEWQLRKESCDRLRHYIQKRKAPQKILEVGCGNGWLARQLSKIPGTKVTGSDINAAELQQAVRVFNDIPNLQFIYADLDSREIEDSKYDLVIFAASIQYFPSLKVIISLALRKLKTNGEIHILDSFFYKPGKIGLAKERTARYYGKLGFPEMTEHYFQHSTKELNYFHFKTLYKPSLVNRVFNNKNPFPWLCIEKQ